MKGIPVVVYHSRHEMKRVCLVNHKAHVCFLDIEFVAELNWGRPRRRVIGPLRNRVFERLLMRAENNVKEPLAVTDNGRTIVVVGLRPIIFRTFGKAQ